MTAYRERTSGSAVEERLVERVRQMARPLQSPADLDPLLGRIGDARFVLLGEASHGTADYYAWRAALSERLIAEKGFSFIAVEGDWPDCYRVNRYITHYPDSGTDAREVLSAFTRWPTWMWAKPTSCEREVVAMLTELRGNAEAYREDGAEAYFNAEQNAAVARNAERYYRTMIRGGAESWNVRDRHMVETLERLAAHHGPQAKAIVWEHNTHVGDARATDMRDEGMVNVGQLVREQHSLDGVVLVGFGSYQGSVIAGEEWDAPMEELPVPAARDGSWEDLLHRADMQDMLLLFPEHMQQGDELFARRGHRAIGVVYHPGRERWGNYVPTVLPSRYDAFLFIDKTRALRPLQLAPYDQGEPPATYPWNT